MSLSLRFACRRRLAADWTSGNEVLLNGEIGFETDTYSFKIGDGVTAWNDIADYFTVDDGGGGVTDHGALTGLADDDHTQYLNVARGDARYYTETETDALLAGKETAGAAATAQANAIATASSDATTKANAAQAAAISAASTDATSKANAAQSAAISAAATDATTKANAAQAAAIAASDPAGSAAAAQAASQPLDSDLTAVAALSPSNDDILQRKAGAWTNRTMAQLASDLGSPSLSSANTWTAQNIFAAGTITTSQPFTISQTWNAGGVTFEGLVVDLTNTASAAASLALNIKVGGAGIFRVDRAGNVNWSGSPILTSAANFFFNSTMYLNGNAVNNCKGSLSTHITLISTSIYKFHSGTNLSSGAADGGIARKAAKVIEFNDGTLGSYVGTAYGSGSQTVAQLPAAATAGKGARSFVTDATATTFLSTVAGGGSNNVPVVSDGTNWLIG